MSAVSPASAGPPCSSPRSLSALSPAAALAKEVLGAKVCGPGTYRTVRAASRADLKPFPATRTPAAMRVALPKARVVAVYEPVRAAAGLPSVTGAGAP